MAEASPSWPAVLHTPAFKETIRKSRVLCVGAGGIGCELLKTLVASGFRNIEVIDLDTIETSNLNRQFLFRKHHVGHSKAEVAAQVIRKMCPDAEIVAHHGNVKDARFGIDYIKGFDVILNGLDNLDARRHVNRLCLATNKPLVESGTQGYLGQVTSHLKGITECYECMARAPPKTYAICTLRNTPDKPIHCIVWAKELLFPRLFGDPSQISDLDEQQKEDGEREGSAAAANGGPPAAGEGGAADGEAQEAGGKEDAGFYLRGEGEGSLEYAERVFRRVFHDDIQRLLGMEDLWKTRRPPATLRLKEILPDTAPLAPTDADATASSASKALGLTNHHQVWSLQDNARVFLKSIVLYLHQRSDTVGTTAAAFDKDDDLAVDFVAAAANLRSACYGIPQQSAFAAKGMAGNIIHAIATTNAIVSGFIVVEAMKLLAGVAHSKLSNTFIHGLAGRSFRQGQVIRELITAASCPGPNPGCVVCGRAQLHLAIDTATTKLSTFIDLVLKKRLSTSEPYIGYGDFSYYTADEENSEDEVAAKQALLLRPLAALPQGGIVHGSVVVVGDDQQDFEVQLLVQHRDDLDEEEAPEGFILSGKVPEAKKPAASSEAEAGPSTSVGAKAPASHVVARREVRADGGETLCLDDSDEEDAGAGAADDPKGKRPAAAAEAEGGPPAKRARIEVVEDDDGCIVLD